MSSSAPSPSPLAPGERTASTTIETRSRDGWSEIVVELPPAPLDTKQAPFVMHTLTTRVPSILERTVGYNKGKLTGRQVDAIRQLAKEMKEDARLRLIADGAADQDEWNSVLKPHVDKGMRWSEAPWFVWETYVYRRMLEATDYWKTGNRFDYFAAEKLSGLENTKSQVQIFTKQMSKMDSQWNYTSFRTLVLADLWGNKADMSLFTAKELKNKTTDDLSDKLLCDDVKDVFQILERGAVNPRKGRRVVFFNDNSGLEIFSDLLLAFYLIRSKQVRTVEFKLKPFPFFVSDAMPEDIKTTVNFLKNLPDTESKMFGKAIEELIEGEKIILSTEPFLASPHPTWKMPQMLRSELQKSADLIIVKGDLMYRKLLGDYQHPWDTKFADFMSYAPCPLVSLRTCKAPLLIGLKDKAQGINAQKKDKDFLINGKYGVIQLVDPPSRKSVVSYSEDTFTVKFQKD